MICSLKLKPTLGHANNYLINLISYPATYVSGFGRAELIKTRARLIT
jgi:hypothetical protein